MRSLLLPTGAGPTGTPCAVHKASAVHKANAVPRAGTALLLNNTPRLRSRGTLRASVALGAALVALVPSFAAAQECPTDRPNSIYGTGGSAITATMKAVAIQLAGLDEPINVFWSDPGACTGFDELLADAIVTKRFLYWDADGTEHQCDPPVTGQPADFAHMGNAADFCPDRTLPDDIGDFFGPVQTVNVFTHIDADANSISAEALYFAYGFGAEGEAAPWVEESFLWGRNTTSFVHLFLAEAINVPPTNFKIPDSNVVQSNSETIAGVFAGTANPDATLGYASGSAVAAAADQVKILAYQHYGQSCGYLPDSSPTAVDKLNVRTGQYYLWTPGHFYAPLNDEGEIADPVVRSLITWFSGAVEAPFDITSTIIGSGDIPVCAMRATREGTIGAISSFAPENPCGCLFQYATEGDTSCDSCEDDSDCGEANPKCRFGYCEAY